MSLLIGEMMKMELFYRKDVRITIITASCYLNIMTIMFMCAYERVNGGIVFCNETNIPWFVFALFGVGFLVLFILNVIRIKGEKLAISTGFVAKVDENMVVDMNNANIYSVSVLERNKKDE